MDKSRIMCICLCSLGYSSCLANVKRGLERSEFIPSVWTLQVRLQGKWWAQCICEVIRSAEKDKVCKTFAASGCHMLFHREACWSTSSSPLPQVGWHFKLARWPLITFYLLYVCTSWEINNFRSCLCYMVKKSLFLTHRALSSLAEKRTSHACLYALHCEQFCLRWNVCDDSSWIIQTTLQYIIWILYE